jgi:hypothetical protein
MQSYWKVKKEKKIVPINGFLLEDIILERREILATHSLIHSDQQTPYYWIILSAPPNRVLVLFSGTLELA